MKVLAVVRDIAVIGLFAVACFFVFSERSARMEQLRTQETRLTTARNAITKLDEVYKQVVFNDSDNKGIYQQIFRQNEVLLEYQKLILTTAYLPAPAGDVFPSVPAAVR
jgi:hypothetical protein